MPSTIEAPPELQHLFKFAHPDALPPESRMGKLWSAYQEQERKVREIGQQISALDRQQSQVEAWLRGARLSTTTPTKFAEEQARVILIEREIQALRNQDLHSATVAMNNAMGDFNQLNGRYIELCQELEKREHWGNRPDEAERFRRLILEVVGLEG